MIRLRPSKDKTVYDVQLIALGDSERTIDNDDSCVQTVD